MINKELDLNISLLASLLNDFDIRIGVIYPFFKIDKQDKLVKRGKQNDYNK